MNESIYKEDVYKRFANELKARLAGPNIRPSKHKDLREAAVSRGIQSIFGSYGWRSAISSRIGPKTVYLGGRAVRLPRPSALHLSIIEKAPEELEKVLHLIKTLPFIHLRRRMGENNEYNPVCNLYMSVADPKNYRLAYMWGNTVFDPSRRRPGPEFTMLHIPDEHQLQQQVLVLPEYNINIALGTDYMGEDKKGFLRQAMWSADRKGMLGLHAGTKVVTARDSRDNKLKKHGVFLFGLSATGKSTWSCHQLGLDYHKGEITEVAQDDIVFLKKDGAALGSEQNYFVKTDVDPKLQEAMYNSLTHKSALMENVMIDSQGKPDFLDETLCGNGRAVISKNKLRIRVGRRFKRIDYKSVNLPPLEDLDGMAFAFITRRNTIMPFAQRLTPEQAILAYLWGESTHSYASQPAKAGESVRTVGTDPFIIGSRAQKVNIFHDIIMDLNDRFPGKISFYMYNTGGMGEILDEFIEDGVKKKRMIRKTERVPINLMAAIQRGDLRGTNVYEKGRLGTEEIATCIGGDVSPYRPEKFYSEEQIADYVRDLVKGRMAFTEEIANEGLKPEIIRAAEKSYTVAPRSKSTAYVRQAQDKEKQEKKAAKIGFVPWRTKSRLVGPRD